MCPPKSWFVPGLVVTIEDTVSNGGFKTELTPPSSFHLIHAFLSEFTQVMDRAGFGCHDRG
jgi:hypothetical protein